MGDRNAGSQKNAKERQNNNKTVTKEASSQQCPAQNLLSFSLASLQASQIISPLLVVGLAVLTGYLLAPHTHQIRRQAVASLDRYLLFWRPTPPGHGRPIGSHRPPLGPGIDILDEFPHPSDFYKRYVRPQRPALFRGLARRHPGFQRWTDDYLSKTFGEVQVDVEVRKKEDRTAGLRKMSMKDFLSVYKDQELYIVDSVGDELRSDLVLPRLAHCGGMQRSMFDIVMWFSSGGTNSVLHYDELDNLNCLLDGSKRFFLVDVDDAHHIDFDRMEGRYSTVDVESVDMYMFPGMRDVPWYNVTMEKGDCFYLPFNWPHQVNSSDTRNVAVNMWFSRLLWHNETDCVGKEPTEVPLSEVEMPESIVVSQLTLITRAENYTQLTLPTFTDLYKDVLPEDEHSVEESFDALDANRDGLVTLREMYEHEPVRFSQLFPRDDADN